MAFNKNVHKFVKDNYLCLYNTITMDIAYLKNNGNVSLASIVHKLPKCFINGEDYYLKIQKSINPYLQPKLKTLFMIINETCNLRCKYCRYIQKLPEGYIGTVLSYKIKKNIERLIEHHCSVKLQTTVTRLNIGEIDTILEFSKNLGIQNRVFLSHSPNGNGKNIHLLDVIDWLEVIKYIKGTYLHAAIELPDLFSGKLTRKCGWGVHR